MALRGFLLCYAKEIEEVHVKKQERCERALKRLEKLPRIREDQDGKWCDPKHNARELKEIQRLREKLSI